MDARNGDLLCVGQNGGAQPADLVISGVRTFQINSDDPIPEFVRTNLAKFRADTVHLNRGCYQISWIRVARDLADAHYRRVAEELARLPAPERERRRNVFLAFLAGGLDEVMVAPLLLPDARERFRLLRRYLAGRYPRTERLCQIFERPIRRLIAWIRRHRATG